jgi:hypothetical protein
MTASITTRISETMSLRDLGMVYSFQECPAIGPEIKTFVGRQSAKRADLAALIGSELDDDGLMGRVTATIKAEQVANPAQWLN